MEDDRLMAKTKLYSYLAGFEGNSPGFSRLIGVCTDKDIFLYVIGGGAYCLLSYQLGHVFQVLNFKMDLRPQSQNRFFRF